MNKTLTLILLLCSSLFTINSSAQVTNLSELTEKVKLPTWQQLVTTPSVTINYKYNECHLLTQGTHHENVYLQVKNLSPVKLKLEWNAEYWYNDKCYGCDGDAEFKKTLILEPNALLEGFCSETTPRELVIFSKMLDFDIKTELKNFNLKNLTVTPIN